MLFKASILRICFEIVRIRKMNVILADYNIMSSRSLHSHFDIIIIS